MHSLLILRSFSLYIWSFWVPRPYGLDPALPQYPLNHQKTSKSFCKSKAETLCPFSHFLLPLPCSNKQKREYMEELEWVVFMDQNQKWHHSSSHSSVSKPPIMTRGRGR